MTDQGQGPGVDWRSIGRGGSRAVGSPTLGLIILGAVMVGLLFTTTIGLEGAGAWVVRVVAGVLAIPVVWLAIRRQQVLARLAEMERTGEHPDNVVRTVTTSGDQVEIIVSGAERSVVPRLGVGGLAALSVATLVSCGLSFGLILIVGLARLI
ncbi:hypothetical protein [Serinibacter salmoneus]|uniref:Uncharacterized protein n=1 Tax=Serinibacter salmoneus TaxID=556530 RepID=A0A2A9D2E7_9MICO|nr:hypothetical protein [Serinibacter salmoneus]PFG20030.1 hypothetical protein ATL40_1613 [Serinibacter salmoneus]